jgi:hypothetical protein
MIYKKYPIKKVKLIIENEVGKELAAHNLKFRDLSYIKKLRNKNRKNFNYKKKITWTQHIKWYVGYLKNLDNFFYILKNNDLNYGTMGIKLKSDGWHIYSVIRDDSVVYEKNLMRILVNGVLQNYIVSKDIFCEVVHGNGAVNWYYKLGFYLVNETKNTYHLVLRKVNRI